MAAVAPRMADINLTDTDREIIDTLREGRNVPANIAEETNSGRTYVQSRLTRMREHGVVLSLGNGVYELVPEEVPDGE